MILNTADIPNLYENEERLEIIEKVALLTLAWKAEPTVFTKNVIFFR